MAAALAALEAAGRVARPERLQREATGGGGALERRMGASANKRRPGRLSTAPASVLCTTAARNRAGSWGKGIRADLKFPKLPGTTL